MSCMWKDKHDCAYCAVQFCDARTDEFNVEKAIASASVPTYKGPDEIDKWLTKEFNIGPGRCSSIEELKYDVARAVAEKLITSINNLRESVRERMDDALLGAGLCDKRSNIYKSLISQANEDMVILNEIDDMLKEINYERTR